MGLSLSCNCIEPVVVLLKQIRGRTDGLCTPRICSCRRDVDRPATENRFDLSGSFPNYYREHVGDYVRRTRREPDCIGRRDAIARPGMANGIRNADAGEAAMALDRPPHFCISIADGKIV